MKISTSALQCGHLTRLAGEGAIATSPTHALHLKCIMRFMKPLAVILLLAISLQAQSVADAARKEQERRASLRPVRVITSANAGKTEESKPKAPAAEEGKSPGAKPEEAKPALTAASKELSKPPAPRPVDPVQIWNDELNKLRAKIVNLQDQETALQLRQNELTNQVYALVIDQATKDQALAQLGQVLQQSATAHTDLEEARKTLDAMVLQGPAKK